MLCCLSMKLDLNILQAWDMVFATNLLFTLEAELEYPINWRSSQNQWLLFYGGGAGASAGVNVTSHRIIDCPGA